jgi:hypothetical protein
VTGSQQFGAYTVSVYGGSPERDADGECVPAFTFSSGEPTSRLPYRIVVNKQTNGDYAPGPGCYRARVAFTNKNAAKICAGSTGFMDLNTVAGQPDDLGAIDVKCAPQAATPSGSSQEDSGAPDTASDDSGASDVSAAPD